MRIFLKALALALLTTGAAQASSVNLLTNGSFESFRGSLNGSGWAFFRGSSVDGWTGGPNIELQSQPTLGLTPQDGRVYAELDTNRNSGLSQSLILDAGRYEMSFWYSPRVLNGPVGTNDMTFSILGGSTNVSGGVTNAPSVDFPHRAWTQIVTQFLVSGDNTPVTFTFAATGPSKGDPCGNCGALIDNVSVTIAPIPLPAGAVLLLTGLGGLAIARRRRTAA